MTTNKSMLRGDRLVNLLIALATLYFMYNLRWVFQEQMIAFDDLYGDGIEAFTIIFMSIILEAIPFVMIGAFISSLIQLFVSEQTIARIIPKNRLIGIVAASMMGFIFPVCECAIIPIVRRLIKKGVPMEIAVTFMVAVPIVNPVVLLSTYYAFSGDLRMMVLRGLLGMLGAVLIGAFLGMLVKDKNILKADEEVAVSSCGCGCGVEHHHPNEPAHGNNGVELFNVISSDHEHDHSHDHQLINDEGCGCGHDHHVVLHTKNPIIVKVESIVGHTSIELYDVGKYLILGAFISALMQTFVDRSYLLSIGQNNVTSTLAMMVLAFVLSLCSEADAFIARTFVGQFTTGSILGFMIYGPMIDIKNTLMLMGSFKKRFAAQVISVITGVCFILALLVTFVKG